MAVKISKAYKPLYTTQKRYIIITGGRGSLKSSTVHDFIARLTYQRGHGILFTRYTLASAELSIIPEFKTTLERLGITDDFHITKHIVTNKRTGSFIYFSGIKTSSGDQTGRLKSIAGITTWVVEEGEDFRDEAAFNKIDDSIRTTTHQNRIIWIQNPTTREHFIYKKMIEPHNRQIIVDNFPVTIADGPQIEHIHTTYILAERLGYLSKDWIFKANEAKKALTDKIEKISQSWTGSPEALDAEIKQIRLDSYYYLNYIGGWRERAEGVIFSNWIEGDFDEKLPSAYGIDYGYNPDPLAVIRVAVDKRQKRIYLKQYIYETSINNVPAALAGAGILKSSLIVADTNEPRTTISIAMAGYNITNARKEMIVDDIREMQNYLLVIDPGSKDLKIELNNYTWNDKKSSVPNDNFNHALDASRYGFRRLVGRKTSGARRKN